MTRRCGLPHHPTHQHEEHRDLRVFCASEVARNGRVRVEVTSNLGHSGYDDKVLARLRSTGYAVAPAFERSYGVNQYHECWIGSGLMELHTLCGKLLCPSFYVFHRHRLRRRICSAYTGCHHRTESRGQSWSRPSQHKVSSTLHFLSRHL